MTFRVGILTLNRIGEHWSFPSDICFGMVCRCESLLISPDQLQAFNHMTRGGFFFFFETFDFLVKNHYGKEKSRRCDK